VSTTRVLVAGLLAAVAESSAGAQSGVDDPRLEGAFTVFDEGANAFGFPAPALSPEERRAFAVGNSFFKQNWITAPASAEGRDGLGPLFNARSCSACHPRDGRSRPPRPGEPETSGVLLRIGVRSAAGPDAPHPIYGTQIQDSAVDGAAPEARVEIGDEIRRGAFGDGTPFELLAPTYRLRGEAYGAAGADAVLGARTAPHLIGLGLLEAIPEEAILVHADPDDRDRDGVSGRPHFLDGKGGASRKLGRFGWKATQPDVRAQTAAAFLNDMGITSSLHPDEAPTPIERARIAFVSGGSPEIDDAKLDRVVFYVRALAVPAQRTPADPQVRAGAERFTSFGCATCHVESFTTGDEAFHPAYRRQTISPRADLLLHDLGPALADEKRDGDARAEEWRTPPLWGVGLIQSVNGHLRLLHDGRARGFAEAILWHGGEAERAKERFRAAPRAERESLLAFLGSL
jgi:CxxC motif-containing protein (DUF1111 family)